MNYQFTQNSPIPISEDKYRKQVMIDFHHLLETKGDDEKAVQHFFEQNPCLVPGAKSEFEMYGSGHGPLFESLITQPKVAGLKTRYPDFLWLSYDSAVFSPVFIEIEAPDKKYFNKDETPTRKFIKARDQLIEWQTLLSKPENIQKFIIDFNIPEDIAELHFDPYYVLIYGRRKEFQDKPWLKAKRAHLMGDGRKLVLMSYDRIEPKCVHKNFICCKVKDKQYFAQQLSPTFKIGPDSNELLNIKNVVEAVDKMLYTTSERKQFLKEKLPYCIDFLNKQAEEENNQDDPKMITFNLADLLSDMQTEE